VLFTSIVAVAQPRALFQPKAEMKVDDPADRIVNEKVLPENRLLVVGTKSIRVWDLASSRLIESRPTDLSEFTEADTTVISPNGRFIILFGKHDPNVKDDKIRRDAAVWNLETGNKIAVLNNTTKPVRYAAWSDNGTTLVTSNETIGEDRVNPFTIEISFWDGETFKYLNSLKDNKITWTYLTLDGNKFLYSVGWVKNELLLFKDLSYGSDGINVWDIKSGKVEQTILADATVPKQPVSRISVSPDERFLTFVTQPLKSKDVDKTLVAWSINKTNSIYNFTRQYEIKPTPKIDDFGTSFSPDGRYLAIVTGNEGYWSVAKGLVVQLYLMQDGAKVGEIANHYRPDDWLNGNQILLFDQKLRMEAVDVATGRKLYETKLVYKTFTNTRTVTSPGIIKGTTNRHTEYYGFEVLDETKILPHPGGKLLLTYSKQYVKLYDVQTGAVLQTLVEPPVDASKPADPKKKPKLSRDPLVTNAAWSNDGNTLYIVSADKKSIGFWSMN
jgi:hypothetical protein